MKRKLAEGGMAEIYLATAVGPEGFSKELVLKVVRSFLARDDGFMKMFIDEARLASRLNHANVVQIFDFDKYEDSYFIAMEYVRGVSLWDLRRRCRELGVSFPITLCAEISVQVARGLNYAHSLTERGRPLELVHRDVTPHNVLMSFDGAVKLTDFGIAKASGNQQSTAAGMLKGKYAYMSPEQARGDKVDARTDVFALGILTWEMLTGGRLFEGDSDVQVLRAVQQSYITPPMRLNPSVPEELDNVVMRALERDLSKRFQSATEFERALAQFVLKNAQSVEDTNIGLFVSRLFNDELEEMRAAELEPSTKTPTPTGLEATALKAPTPKVASGRNPAVLTREANVPTLSEVAGAQDPMVTAPGPELTHKTSAPGKDEAPERPPESEPGVVLRPSFAKEVAEAAQRLSPEQGPVENSEPQATISTTADTADDGDFTAMRVIRQQGHRRRWMTLLGFGFLATLGALWMLVPKSSEVSTPTATALQTPPAVRVPALDAGQPNLETVAVALPEPQLPAPDPQVENVIDSGAATEPPQTEQPTPEPKTTQPTRNEKVKTVAVGTLEVAAIPWAKVSIDGKPEIQIDSPRRFPLKPGEYSIKFNHPKRQKTERVNITSNRVTRIQFKVFDSN